jgi:hypothetical protein
MRPDLSIRMFMPQIMPFAIAIGNHSSPGTAFGQSVMPQITAALEAAGGLSTSSISAPPTANSRLFFRGGGRRWCRGGFLGSQSVDLQTHSLARFANAVLARLVAISE